MPYNPAKEPLPRKEVNHKSFEEAERVAHSIPAEMLAMIEEQGGANEDIIYIRDMAKKALLPKYPTGVKVGLRGDSGTGECPISHSRMAN